MDLWRNCSAEIRHELGFFSVWRNSWRNKGLYRSFLCLCNPLFHFMLAVIPPYFHSWRDCGYFLREAFIDKGVTGSSQTEFASSQSAANDSGKRGSSLASGGELDSAREERQKLALRYVHENGSITNKEYRAVTGASENTALRDLDHLVELGSLRAFGKRRAALQIALKGNVPLVVSPSITDIY